MSWDCVDESCMLCEMSKKTRWYFEDEDLVIADTLSGSPFVVWKEHKKSLTEDEWEIVRDAVRNHFGEDMTLTVIMAHCPHHWHAHIG